MRARARLQGDGLEHDGNTTHGNRVEDSFACGGVSARLHPAANTPRSALHDAVYATQDTVMIHEGRTCRQKSAARYAATICELLWNPADAQRSGSALHCAANDRRRGL